MRKILIIFLLLVIASAFIVLNNNNPRVIIHDLPGGLDIKTGSLIYRINLLGILPIGRAEFSPERIEEYEGKMVYHLNTKAQTYRFYEKFFYAAAALDSYVDALQFYPLFFRQKGEVSGKGSLDKEITYDQKNNIMAIGGIKRKIFPDTQDPLSAIFNIRLMDFDKVKLFEMNLNTNQKNYILKATAASEDISISKKSYRIILVKGDIARRDKNPYHKTRIDMVILKGQGNIPVLINIFSSGILLNARLIDVK